MKKFSLLLIAVHVFLILSAQEKLPMDHSVYEDWKDMKNIQLTNDGQYIVYEVNPQMGDGDLIIRNNKSAYELIIPRAYDAKISENSRFIVGKIKPQFELIRAEKKIKRAKLNKPKTPFLCLILRTEVLRNMKK